MDTKHTKRNYRYEISLNDVFFSSDKTLLTTERKMLKRFLLLGDEMKDIDNLSNYYYQAYVLGFSIGDTTNMYYDGVTITEMRTGISLEVMRTGLLDINVMSDNSLM